MAPDKSHWAELIRAASICLRAAALSLTADNPTVNATTSTTAQAITVEAQTPSS